MLRPNQTKNPHCPQPAGFGWHILQTLKRTIHPTPLLCHRTLVSFSSSTCLAGLLHQTGMPTEPSPERTGPGRPLHSSLPSLHAEAMMKRRSVFQRSAWSTLPFEICLGASPNPATHCKGRGGHQSERQHITHPCTFHPANPLSPRGRYNKTNKSTSDYLWFLYLH